MQILFSVGISHANVLKISNCFYLILSLQSVIFQLGSVNVIIIYQEKGKTDDLRKLSTQNIIKIRMFSFMQIFQACKLV